MNSIDSVVNFPFHGTCRHCRHFHKNWAFPLPSNGAHLRVKCERCSRDMFGLGRADTQYSLASVDSLPLSQVGFSPAPERLGCSDAPQPSLRTATQSSSEDASQLPQPSSEGRSGIQDSNQPQPAGVVPIRMQDHSTSASPSTQSRSQSTAPIFVRALQTLPYHQTLLGATDYVNIFGASFAGRYLQRPREYSIFGWRFVLHPPNHDANSNTTTALHTPQHTNVTTIRGPTASSLVEEGPQNNATSHTVSIPPLSTSVAGNAGSNRSESHASDVQVGGAHTNHRLLQFRRELTLRRNALQRPTCMCTRDCHCIPEAASDLDSRDTPSTRVRDPIAVDEVPSEPVVDRLTGGRFLGFSHVGSHLSRQAQPASHGSDSTVDSGQSTTFSQAPTVGSGNSVSLRPSRPRINIRSRSMPL